jgi:uncharacterized protein YndB with AHSA1/START domain
MQKDIRHEWFFDSPPEKVWEALTDPELLARWLMKNDFRPVVGHRFRFITNPRVKIGFDGVIYCEVLEVAPLRRLVYSWKGGPGEGRITLDSVVSWTLTPKDDGTVLLLEQTGFRGLQNYISYLIMNKGWKTRIWRKLKEAIKRQTHEAAR